MRNRLLIPPPGTENDGPVDGLKSPSLKVAASPAKPSAIPELVKPLVAPPPPATTIESGNSLGPRKLVRPKLPPRRLGSRYAGPRTEQPTLAHHAAIAAAAAHNQESSHAEAFYFQKQIQMQTPLVFVLEDGQQVEGILEWYDRSVLKVKNSGRVLIYKASIKYLYKAGEKNPET